MFHPSMRRRTRRGSAAAGCVAALLLAAACGGDDSSGDATTAAPATTAAATTAAPANTAAAADTTAAETATTAAATTAAPATTAAAPTELKKLRLQPSYVPDVQNFGYWYALDQGYYAEEGLDVEILAFTSGLDPIQVVAAGQADVGISNPDSIMNAVTQDIPVIGFGVTLQEAPTSLTCREDSGVTKLSDLVDLGVTVGLKPNVELTFGVFMSRNGIDVADVKTAPIQGGSNIAEISAGQVDCMFTTFRFNEPELIKQNGVPVVVFPLFENNYRSQVGAFAAQPDKLAEDPELFEAFLRASARGWQALIDDPEMAATYSVESGRVPDLDIVQQTRVANGYVGVLQSDVTAEKGLLYPSPDVWEEQASILLDSGVLDRAPAVEEMLDMSIADAVYP